MSRLTPNNPPERLAQIIEHSEATALLTNSRNLALARQIWSAVAERSADTALDQTTQANPKRRRRFALPAHSKNA